MPVNKLRDVLYHLPQESRVAVTASSEQPIEETIELSVEMTDEYQPIPHLTARQVKDRQHLDDIQSILRENGILDIFVIGGDIKKPIGEYEESRQLLEDIDNRFRVGVGGYPEGHHIFDDNLDILRNKLPYADYVSTQICYSPESTKSWVKNVRSISSDIDILIGVPGVINCSKLRGISERIGVGKSLNRIDNRDETYEPDTLISDMCKTANIDGFHLNTFNEVEKTVDWVQDTDLLEIESFLQ
jgi:methylenetetrahydrofolate reductase (NADPH)